LKCHMVKFLNRENAEALSGIMARREERVFARSSKVMKGIWIDQMFYFRYH